MANTFKVIQDIDAEAPDFLAATIGYVSRRYALGTKHMNAEELDAIAASEEYYSLPVYAYVHSGATISTSSFSCPFDSGRSGLVFIRKDDPALEGVEDPLELLRGEVAVFDSYLCGEIYTVLILDQEGTVVDSVGGIYGQVSAEAEGKAMIEA